MFGMRRRVGKRHLVRAEGAFDLPAVDDFRSGPSLRRRENDHRPARTRDVAANASVLLDRCDLFHCHVERGSHRFVHRRWLVPLDEIRRPPVTAKQLLQFLAGDAGEQRGIRDLVTVQMQDRQHRSVGEPDSETYSSATR